MGRISNGLPGQNVGGKAHGFFMRGHADGTCGRPHCETIAKKVSKPCQKAYDRGFEKGAAERTKRLNDIWCKCEDQDGMNVVYFEQGHTHGWNCASCGKLVQIG